MTSKPPVSTVQTIEIQPDGTVLMSVFHFGDPPSDPGTHELHHRLARHIADLRLDDPDGEGTVWRCASMLATAGQPSGARMDGPTAHDRLEEIAAAIRPLVNPEGD